MLNKKITTSWLVPPVLFAVASVAAVPVSLAAGNDQDNWIGTWSAAPSALDGAAQYTNL
jgi:hypothetical protein